MLLEQRPWGLCLSWFSLFKGLLSPHCDPCLSKVLWGTGGMYKQMGPVLAPDRGLSGLQWAACVDDCGWFSSFHSDSASGASPLCPTQLITAAHLCHPYLVVGLHCGAVGTDKDSQHTSVGELWRSGCCQRSGLSLVHCLICANPACLHPLKFFFRPGDLCVHGHIFVLVMTAPYPVLLCDMT